MPPCGQDDLGTAEISFIIISKESLFVKRNICFFEIIFGNTLFGVIHMRIWKRAAIFLAGGMAYVGMELLWRGFSHISMFFAGGLCLLLIGHLGEVTPKLPLPIRVPVGAMIIIMVELGTGLLVNREYAVWDYRGMPGNFLGQICPQFFLLWLPLSWLAVVMYEKLVKLLG